MKIRPKSDIVIIRRSAPQEVSDGGIYLVHNPDFREDIGVVAYVGSGKRYGCRKCKTEHLVPVSVKPGDKVIFSTNGHQITTINGEELVVLREPSIIGVIEDGTVEPRGPCP